VHVQDEQEQARQHEHRALREVDDVHDAEDERQPEGDEHVEAGDHHAVDGDLDVDGRGHGPGLSIRRDLSTEQLDQLLGLGVVRARGHGNRNWASIP